MLDEDFGVIVADKQSTGAVRSETLVWTYAVDCANTVWITCPGATIDPESVPTIFCPVGTVIWDALFARILSV